LQFSPGFAYGDGIRLGGVTGPAFTRGMIKVVAVLGSEMEISKDLGPVPPPSDYSWRRQRRAPTTSLG